MPVQGQRCGGGINPPIRHLTLEGSGWSPPCPGLRACWWFYMRLGWLQGRSRRQEKSRPPPGFDPQIVQIVASCHTDWATPATFQPSSLRNQSSKRTLNKIGHDQQWSNFPSQADRHRRTSFSLRMSQKDSKDSGRKRLAFERIALKTVQKSAHLSNKQYYTKFSRASSHVSWLNGE